MADAKVMPKTHRERYSRQPARPHVWLFLLCMFAAWQPVNHANAASLDLVGLNRVEQDLREQVTELGRAVERLLNENKLTRERLQRDEVALRAEAISIRELRDARFELDSLGSRITTIANRMRQREVGLRRLEDDLQAEQEVVRSKEENTLGRVLAEVRLRQLSTLRDVQQSLVALLDRMRSALSDRRALTSERVAMLQARADLSTIEASMTGEDDPRIALIRGVIGTLVRESVRLSNEASQLSSAGADPAQIRLLELQSDEALLRAGIRQADIELLNINKRLILIRSLVDDRSVPTRLIDQALQRVNEFSVLLDDRREAIEDERQTLLAQQQGLAARARQDNPAIATALQRISDVQSVLELQRNAVQTMRDGVRALDETLRNTLASAHTSGLFDRVELPDDRATLARLGASLQALPTRLARRWRSIRDNLIDRIRNLERPELYGLVAVGLAVLLLLGLVRSRMARFIARRDDKSLMLIPARAARSVLLWLIPALLWLAAALYLDLDPRIRNELLVLLLVVPAALFALRLTHLTFVERAPAHRMRRRRRFYSRLWLAVWAVALVTVSVVLTRNILLSPLATALFDRLAFLTFVLISFPLLQSRSLILSLYGEQLEESSVSVNLISWSSLAVPLTLAGCGLVGLTGFVNLAWAMAAYIGWLCLVGAALLLVVAMLRDGYEERERRYRLASPETSQFWLSNIYRPLYRLALLGLYVLAGYALLRLFDWDESTPWISAALMVLKTNLFSIGQAKFTPASLLSAVVLIWLTFWVGGWSRQVTYNVAYSRIRDAGIRASLSVFTQYIVVVLGLFIALQVIGLDLTALAVFAGALGVGIGFGLQNITNNFLSGVLLLAERPLRVTDIVTVGEHMGEVTRIGIRSLTVKTPDQQEVIIPNAEVISKSFINWTRTDDVSRELLMIGISYDNEPDEAIELISNIVNNFEPILQTPKPLVTLFEFADSAVIIRLHYFVSMRGSMGKLAVRSEVLRQIWQQFAEKGIGIPFPQRDLHLNIEKHDQLAGLLAAPEAAQRTAAAGPVP